MHIYMVLGAIALDSLTALVHFQSMGTSTAIKSVASDNNMDTQSKSTVDQAAANDEDELFLVDGSGYIFRAYHALPPLNRKSDGLQVNAVLGFCNMVWKLMQDARNTDVGVTPTHFAVIFDYSSKTFRNELYPEYKANRSAPPEDLVPQFGLIRQAITQGGAEIEAEGPVPPGDRGCNPTLQATPTHFRPQLQSWVGVAPAIRWL